MEVFRDFLRLRVSPSWLFSRSSSNIWKDSFSVTFLLTPFKLHPFSFSNVHVRSYSDRFHTLSDFFTNLLQISAFLGAGRRTYLPETALFLLTYFIVFSRV